MKMNGKYLILLLLVLFKSCLSFAGISVINGLTHVHQVKEGMVYKGYIEIQNTGDFRQLVSVSQKDFLCNSKGESFYNDSELHNRSNMRWIELKTTDINLGPKEKYKLLYQVMVPSKLEMPGSYWSVLMIEPVDEIKPKFEDSAVNVITRVRYAVQIVCNSESTANAEIRFKSSEVQNIQGRRYLSVELEDSGELYHQVTLNAEFFDLETGISAGSFDSPAQSLFPYTSKRFVIEITNLKSGKYKGLLLANCSDDNVFGVNLELVVSDE